MSRNKIPRIRQIVLANSIDRDGYQMFFLYGLAEDGSVWEAAPNGHLPPKWSGPVVLGETGP